MMRSWLARLWRLRGATVGHLQAGDQETHGGTPSESEGLTTREAYGVHPGPRAGEDGSPSSISEAESKRGKFPFLFLFVLFRLSVDWRAISSMESTDSSNASVVWKYPHRHIQKSCSV